MSEPTKHRKSVNAMVVSYGSHLLEQAQKDAKRFHAFSYDGEETKAILLRGHLTAYACLSKMLGLSEEDMAARLEAFAGRIRSGESEANAKAWIAEAVAFDAEHYVPAAVESKNAPVPALREIDPGDLVAALSVIEKRGEPLHPWDRAFLAAYRGETGAGMNGQEATGVAYEATEQAKGTRPECVGYGGPFEGDMSVVNKQKHKASTRKGGGK